MKYFFVLLLACMSNAYAFELVCKGQSLRNGEQRPIYVNCDSKEDIVKFLGAATDFLSKKDAPFAQQQNCLNPYQQAKSMDQSQISALAKGGYLQMCNDGLSNYK
jgi:hypothetical protein